MHITFHFVVKIFIATKFLCQTRVPLDSMSVNIYNLRLKNIIYLLIGTCPLLLNSPCYSVVSYNLYSSGQISVLISFGSHFQVIECGSSGQWNDTSLNTYISTITESQYGNNNYDFTKNGNH